MILIGWSVGSSRAQPIIYSSASLLRSLSRNGKGSSMSKSCEMSSTRSFIALPMSVPMRASRQPTSGPLVGADRESPRRSGACAPRARRAGSSACSAAASDRPKGRAVGNGSDGARARAAARPAISDLARIVSRPASRRQRPGGPPPASLSGRAEYRRPPNGARHPREHPDRRKAAQDCASPWAGYPMQGRRQVFAIACEAGGIATRRKRQSTGVPIGLPLSGLAE